MSRAGHTSQPGSEQDLVAVLAAQCVDETGPAGRRSQAANRLTDRPE